MQLDSNRDLIITFVTGMIAGAFIYVWVAFNDMPLADKIVVVVGFGLPILVLCNKFMCIVYDLHYDVKVVVEQLIVPVQADQVLLEDSNPELPSSPRPQGPAKYLARPAAIAARTAADICPITFELLTVYTSAFVGTCGHVGGPEITKCKKCPSCLSLTGWTEITFPA
jgi:hypothetical protein